MPCKNDSVEGIYFEFGHFKTQMKNEFKEEAQVSQNLTHLQAAAYYLKNQS